MVKAAKALVLSCLASVALAAGVMAAEGPLATFHVKLEANPTQTVVNPVAESPITQDMVAFRIMNNTGKEVWFMVGDEKHYVPMVSQNTFEVPYLKGDVYKVVDKDGDVLAHWAIQDATVAKAMMSSAAETEAKYNAWGQTLQQVIQNNQAVAVSTYRQQESQPMQRMSAPAETEEGSTVRGYW